MDQCGSLLQVHHRSNCGAYVALNSKDYYIAGGYRYSKRGQGQQWNGSSWNQLGSDLIGGSGSEFGHSVSINSTGGVIGASTHVGGQVKIYGWNGSSWVQFGNTLTGDYDFDNDIPLSNDGTMVCIGDGTGVSSSVSANIGMARVYQWNGSTWNQVGYDMVGEAAGDNAGYAVAMNGDGKLSQLELQAMMVLVGTQVTLVFINGEYIHSLMKTIVVTINPGSKYC